MMSSIDSHVSAGVSVSVGLSVVVPTYNEALCIRDLLTGLGSPISKLNAPAEVIIVDDTSSDGTAGIAESLAHRLPFPLHVLRRTGTRSLSLSVIAGAARARFRSVVVLDADLSHDPEDIPRVAAPVLSGDADVAVGSRYTLGGRVSDWPLHRRLLSSLGTRLARVLTQVRDPLSGFFAAKKELLDGSSSCLHPRGYKILLEVLGRNHGARTVEVPICFRDRACGQSKFTLRQSIDYLLQLGELFVSWARDDTEIIQKIEGREISRQELFSKTETTPNTFLETHS